MSTDPDDVTQGVWITRKTTTAAHFRALVAELDQANALDYAQVTIMAVDAGEAIVLPGGKIVKEVDLPVRGMLLLPERSP